MDAPQATRPRRGTGLRRAALLLAFVAGLAGLSPVALGQPRWRMDPDQRERLRHELRDHEHRGEPDHMRRAPVPASPAYVPRESPRGHGHPRMSPEERQQLRMQLRERHRARH